MADEPLKLAISLRLGVSAMTDDCRKCAATALPITIAIPTYRREQVLIDTIQCLLRLDPCAAEILVLDFTILAQGANVSENVT